MIKNFYGTIILFIFFTILSFCAFGKVVYNYYNYVPKEIKYKMIDTDGIEGINLYIGDISCYNGKMLFYNKKEKSTRVLEFEKYIMHSDGNWTMLDFNGYNVDWRKDSAYTEAQQK